MLENFFKKISNMTKIVAKHFYNVIVIDLTVEKYKKVPKKAYSLKLYK